MSVQALKRGSIAIILTWSDEEPEVAPFFAERVCLKQRHAFRPDGEEVEDLADDQRDEIDTLTSVEEVVELSRSVAVEALAPILVEKEHVADGNSCILPHVEEKHAHRTEHLHETNKEIRLRVDFEADL